MAARTPRQTVTLEPVDAEGPPLAPGSIALVAHSFRPRVLTVHAQQLSLYRTDNAFQRLAVWAPPSPAAAANAAAFSVDCSKIFAAGADGSVTVLGGRSLEPVVRLVAGGLGHGVSALCIAASPGGLASPGLIAVGCTDGSVQTLCPRPNADGADQPADDGWAAVAAKGAVQTTKATAS